jgi:hypothetical protein
VPQCFLPCFGTKSSHSEMSEANIASARVNDAVSYAYISDRHLMFEVTWLDNGLR